MPPEPAAVPVPLSVRRRRAALAFVWVTVFLDILAAGIIAPILPKLVLSFLGGAVGHAAEIVGLMGTVFGLMHFLFSVAQGALSDRFGRRPVILTSNFGLGLDYIVMALAPGIGWLFAGRIVSGITAASVMTSFTYVTDITPPDKRTRAYGVLGMAGGLGFMAGPALGGFLGEIDLRLPFWIAAALSLSNGVYGFFVIPESHARENRSRLTWRRFNPLGGLATIRSPGDLRLLVLSGLLVQFATLAVPTVFVLYTGWRFDWSAHDSGLGLGAMSLGALVVQGWLLGVLMKRFSERFVLLLGLGFNAAGLLVVGFAPVGLAVWAGLPLIALGGLAGPASIALMTRRVAPSEQGHMLGSLSSLVSIASLIAPSAFAAVFAASIGSLAGWGLPGAAFILAGLFYIASLLLCLGLRDAPRSST